MMIKRITGIGLLVLMTGVANGQDCSLFNTYTKLFYYKEGSTASRSHETVKKDTASYNVLFIVDYNQVRRCEILRVSIDLSGFANVEFAVNDSVIVKKTCNISSRFRDAFFATNKLNGSFEGVCPNYNAHTTQTLVVADPVNGRWIELTSLSVPLEEILKRNRTSRDFGPLYDLLILLPSFVGNDRLH